MLLRLSVVRVSTRVNEAIEQNIKYQPKIKISLVEKNESDGLKEKIENH